MDTRNEIKSYIVREGMTMSEVVERLADDYGWSSSVPNLSGKLRRDSLRYREAVELADVLGYDMRRIRRGHIPALRKRIGIVFQDFQLLIDRNVWDNLDFVLKATGWKDKGRRRQRIEEVLEQVGMSTKGYKMPHELSGGEQQRIVIARAILNTPEIILADEPTGNLDPETGRQIVQLLHNICAAGSTVIMTTHNMQLLEEFPGKVFCCDGHRLIESQIQSTEGSESSESSESLESSEHSESFDNQEPQENE